MTPTVSQKISKEFILPRQQCTLNVKHIEDDKYNISRTRRLKARAKPKVKIISLLSFSFISFQGHYCSLHFFFKIALLKSCQHYMYFRELFESCIYILTYQIFSDRWRRRQCPFLTFQSTLVTFGKNIDLIKAC